MPAITRYLPVGLGAAAGALAVFLASSWRASTRPNEKVSDYEIPPTREWTDDSSYRSECGAYPLLRATNPIPKNWPFPQIVFPLPRDAVPQSPDWSSLPLINAQQSSQIPDTALDRMHFWNLLVATIPRSHWRVHLPGPKIRILDVACGLANDANPLYHYFARTTLGGTGREVSYLGVDNFSSVIEEARTAYQGQSGLQFLKADATRFNDYPELRGEFDVIVIRHPDVTEGDGTSNEISETWRKILTQSFEHLSQNGLLLITTYQCKEYLIVEDLMRHLGANKELAVRNIFSSPNYLFPSSMRGRIATHIARSDRYVSIYSRGTLSR